MTAIMTIRGRFAAVLCAVATALSAFAQRQPPPVEIPHIGGESVEVSIVNLEVIVTDKKGHRVPGLTKDDFEITEDGKPQPISNFAEYRSEGEPSITGANVAASGTTALPSPPRALIVFVDSLRLPDWSADPVFDAVKKLLHSIVRPQDTVVVARWNYHLIVEQPFTSDLKLIDAALDRVAKASVGPQADTATRMVMEQTQLTDFLKSIAASSGTAFADDPADVTQALGLDSYAQVSKWELDQEVKAMNALMSALPPQSRNAMILLSSHLSAYAGTDVGNVMTQGPMTNEYRERFNTRAILQSIMDTAASHGVTVYPMLPEGLSTRADNPTDMGGLPRRDFGTSNYRTLADQLLPLRDLAAATGGTMQWSSKEVANAMPAIREDLESYYSLAYKVPPRHDNARHHVKVRAKNSAYTARTRGEVVERSDAGAIHDRVIASLYTDALQKSIPLAVQVGALRRVGKQKFTAPVKVTIPIGRLLTVAEGDSKKGAFTVYITSAHNVGAVGDVTKQTIPFTIPPDKAGVQTFTYTFDLASDFMTSRVLIAVVDEVSHDTGYARIDFTPEQFAKAQP